MEGQVVLSIEKNRCGQAEIDLDRDWGRHPFVSEGRLVAEALIGAGSR